MKIPKIIKIIKIMVAIMVIFSIFGLLALIFLTEQNKEFSTNLSCGQLKECVKIDYSCLDEFVENSFFSIKWSFEDKASLSDQKDYYKINCIDFSNDSLNTVPEAKQ